MKDITIGLFLLYNLIWSFNASSQSFVFKNYTNLDGLPSSESYCVLQDRKGYIWIGTDRGLSKFDGYQFKTFTLTDGLLDNTIFFLYEDNRGRIWFFSYSSKIGYIENDVIVPYKYNAIIENTHIGEILTGFSIDDSDKVYFSKRVALQANAFTGNKAYSIDKNGHLDTGFNNVAPQFTRLYLLPNKSFLVSGRNGPGQRLEIVLGAKKIKTNIVFGKTNIVSGGKKNEVHSYAIKNCDDIVFQCNNDIYILKDDSVQKLFSTNKEVIYLFADNDRNIWIGSVSKGIEIFWHKDNYKKSSVLLPGHSVSWIHQDRDGGVWVTTHDNGVYYRYPSAPLVLARSDGLPDRVDRIAEDGKNIFLFTEDYRIFEKTGIELKFKERPERNLNLFYNPRNRLYYSKWDYSYIRAHSKIDDFHEERYKNHGSANIYFGKKHIWVQSYNNFHKYSYSDYSTIDSVYNTPRIKCVFENADGHLLFGTLAGLHLYDHKNVTSLSNRNPSLAARINDIQRIDEKHLALATTGNGIIIMNEKDYSTYCTININERLPSSICNAIFKENDSIVWAGTNHGACRITNILDPHKRKSELFDYSSGLVSNEIHRIQQVNGAIWLFGKNGISIIDRKTAMKPVTTIPLYIESIVVNGKPIKATKSELKYYENNIGFSFIGLCYQYTGKLEYKYRIKELSNKWQYTKGRTVAYNSLVPGTYTFELGVRIPDNNNITTVTRYIFTIQPPFWRTWWFLLIVSAALLLFLWLIIRRRINYIRAQITLKNDLKNYRDMALRSHMNPHFVYNSLNSIQNYILSNNINTSSTYLAKFSQLMRLTFDNTSQEYVTIQSDLEALKLYAELENMRFDDLYTFHIELELKSSIGKMKIPPLIVQPFVENAILHGLRSKQGNGNIWLKITELESMLQISVTDDGVGRVEAARIGDKKNKYNIQSQPATERKNSAIKTTMARIEQAWNNSGKSQFKIIDLYNESNKPVGTTIEFRLRVIYD